MFRAVARPKINSALQITCLKHIVDCLENGRFISLMYFSLYFHIKDADIHVPVPRRNLSGRNFNVWVGLVMSCLWITTGQLKCSIPGQREQGKLEDRN